MAKYPGWRTMTGAQRYNAKMERIFDEARAHRRDKIARGLIVQVLDYRHARGQLVEVYDTVEQAKERVAKLSANDLFTPESVTITEAPLFRGVEP